MATGDAKYVSADNPAMNSMLQALQLFGGLSDTKKTTSDVSSINSVLSQLQGQDFSKLLDTVFQQAAAKTPQLTTQLANATGARTGNNAPLAAALQQVLAAATTQGQAQIAQQQAQNLQTQTELAKAKAQATQRTQIKSNTASGNAQKLMTGLQLGNKASQLLTKKSLYDNLQSVFGGGGGGGASPVAQANMGGGSAVPSLDVTGGNLFPQSSQPTLDSVMAGINSAVSPDVSGLTSALSFSPDSVAPAADLATGTGALAPATDTAGSLNMDDYLNKSYDIGNMDLSFSSDAGASAASGASTASQGIAEGINAADSASTAANTSGSIPWGSYAAAASYLDSSKQKRISNDFSHGGWNDKVGDIGDAAGIFYWPAMFVHPFVDAADVAMTTLDDDLHKGIKGIKEYTNDAQSNIADMADRKYNLADGTFGKGTTEKYNLARPSDVMDSGRGVFDSYYRDKNIVGPWIDDFFHNPGAAVSDLSDHVSDRFAEVDDAVHGIVNGVGNGVNHAVNTIGDTIASVFGW